MGSATGKAIAVTVGIMMVLSAVVIGSQQASEGALYVPPTTNYTTHAPFRINSNAEFTSMAASEGWAGDGSQANPYIIENYEVNGSGNRDCVFIGNTTSYFILRNCYLHNATGTFSEPYYTVSGLGLYNVKNGSVAGNTLEKNIEGIYGNLASYNTFSNNTIIQSKDGGLLLISSPSNNIAYNNCSNNPYGVCPESGSNYNTIFNNNASMNSVCGFYISNSNGNIIFNNTASSNTQYGFYFKSSDGNTIYRNNIINNTNQAYDNRNDNWWNTSYPIGGNYWSNYSGLDLKSGIAQDQPGSDGLGDTKFIIDSDSIDYYPLVPLVQIILTNPIDGAANISISVGTYVIQFNKIMNTSVGSVSTNLPCVMWSWSVDSAWLNGTYATLENFTFYYIDLTGGGFMDSTGDPLSGDLYKAFSTGGSIHPPIRINSNAEFASMALSNSWTGDGTEGNPYIIERYDINGTGYGYCVYIGNTTVFFQIRNSYFYHASGVDSSPYYWDSGIIFYSVQNGTLSDCIIEYNNRMGLYAYNCSNITFTRNNLSYNNDYTIFTEYMTYSKLQGNRVIQNYNWAIVLGTASYYNMVENNIVTFNSGSGLYLLSASSNLVANNTITNQQLNGICIDGNSDSNTIINNTISANSRTGIWMDGDNWAVLSTNNLIVNNPISNNGYEGIYIWLYSKYNMIYHNNFQSNNHGNRQAYDNTGTTVWNDIYPSGGNYWSNYAGTDIYSGPNQDLEASDFIGDTPCTFPANSDQYPLMVPFYMNLPRILNTDPMDGMLDISTITSTYVIQFSSVMDTLKGTIATNLLNATWGWSSDRLWLNGSFSQLENTTKYFVDLTDGGFCDVGGNPLVWDTYKVFYTAPALSVIVTNPTGASNNPRPNISYIYSDKPTSVQVYYTQDIGVNWIYWGTDYDVDGLWIPDTSLPSTGTYYWNARGIGAVNETVPRGSASIESGPYNLDITFPSIVGTAPADNSINISLSLGTFSIQFSEPMNVTVGLIDTNMPNAIWTWSVNVIWYNCTCSILQPGFVYYINLTGKGFMDLCGNLLTGDMYKCFTTLSPTAVYTFPIDWAVNISVSTNRYIIQFNEPLNPSMGTIDTNLPNATWTWNSDFTWLNGTSSILVPLTVYYVNLVDRGFVDAYGNALGGDMYKCFTTVNCRWHLPIRINSDSEFDAGHGVCAGNGTKENPFVFEKYDINGTGYGYCIYIGNTTSYFTVRDCFIHEASGNSDIFFKNTGILLFTAQHGYVVNSTILSNDYGFYLRLSSNNSIMYNNVSGNYIRGMRIQLDSNYNTIAHNVVLGNIESGVFNDESDYNLITDNILCNNYYGIFNYGHMWGISNGIIISNNTISNNNIGIYLNAFWPPLTLLIASGSDGNYIFHNNFINNGIQAEGWPDFFWNQSYPIGGNYWSDYTGTDKKSGPLQDQPDSDGIGDTPYIIDSYTQDNYPLISPWLPPPTITVKNSADKDFASPGDLLTYTIFFNNTGASNSMNIWINNTLPLGVIYINDSSNLVQGYSGKGVSGQNLFFNYSNMVPGSYSFQITVQSDGGLSYGTVLTNWVFLNYTDARGNLLTGSSANATTIVSRSYTIPLITGWNLISFPLVPYDTSITAVLSSISGKWDCVQWYDSFDAVNPWKQYNTHWSSSLNDLTRLDNTMGFWINVTESTTLIVYGQAPTSNSIPLHSGWNLVGYPSLCTNMTVANALWGTGATMVEVFDTNATYRTRVVGPTYLMRPGEGYWVYVPTDSVWTVNW